MGRSHHGTAVCGRGRRRHLGVATHAAGLGQATAAVDELIGYWKTMSPASIIALSAVRGIRWQWGIESANKFICQVRLKRSGAWWYVANRQSYCWRCVCAKYNGTFGRVFERYRHKILEQSQQTNIKK